MKIAIASSNGENVDLHLGKADSIYIYEYLDGLELIEHRNIDIDKNAKHQGGKVLEACQDCDVIIVEDFGFKTKVTANEMNIILFKGHGKINEVFNEFVNWYEVMK